MATLIETGAEATTGRQSSSRQQAKAAGASSPVMLPWLRAQSINVTRHAAALRPFKIDEFGTGAEAPTAGHLQAVNQLITGLRSGLLKISGGVSKAAKITEKELSTSRLQDLMRKKARAHHWVRAIE